MKNLKNTNILAIILFSSTMIVLACIISAYLFKLNSARLQNFTELSNNINRNQIQESVSNKLLTKTSLSYASLIQKLLSNESLLKEKQPSKKDTTAFPNKDLNNSYLTPLADNEKLFRQSEYCQNLSNTEITTFFQMLCNDNVFENETRKLKRLIIDDFDGNGQKDMIAIVQKPRTFYGEGRIYIYMNNDIPYYFYNDFFPYDNVAHIFWNDLDSDGNIEIVFEANGTGNGGTGDWYQLILRYKNHTMQRMTLPCDDKEHSDNEYGLFVNIAQKPQENTYNAYCPYINETITFHADFYYPYREGYGGANYRGFYNLQYIEYNGKPAIEAWEYLHGEGGIPHSVGIAKFIITWNQDGSSHIADWRIDPWE